MFLQNQKIYKSFHKFKSNKEKQKIQKYLKITYFCQSGNINFVDKERENTKRSENYTLLSIEVI